MMEVLSDGKRFVTISQIGAIWRAVEWILGRPFGHQDYDNLETAKRIAEANGFTVASEARRQWFEMDVLLAGA